MVGGLGCTQSCKAKSGAVRENCPPMRGEGCDTQKREIQIGDSNLTQDLDGIELEDGPFEKMGFGIDSKQGGLGGDFGDRIYQVWSKQGGKLFLIHLCAMQRLTTRRVVNWYENKKRISQLGYKEGN